MNNSGKEYEEILRFAFVGIVGLLTDVAALYLALALGLGFHVGRVASFLAAVFVTWQLNRRYVFNAAVPRVTAWREWWTYLAAMMGGGAFNYAAYSALIAFGPPGPLLPMIAVAAGALAGMTVNFLSAKFVVFRRDPSR
jgi:putative flippase GtrA